jgi:hypothetical protein
MSNKQIALQYLNKGLSIIPLISPSMASKKLSKDEFIKKCKTPLVGWKEFQKRRPTEEEVIAWFDKWPNANIGIVTGIVSGIVVFDLDSEHAVEYAENEGGFPDTPKVKTGKGWHVFAKYPGFEVRNDVRKELDIDIRADGGYVVAPPSYHGNGNQYTWEDGSSIFEIDPSPCEPWMIYYLKEVANSDRKPAKATPPKPSEIANTASKSATDNIYADIAKNGAQQGQRNATAAKYIGHLFGKGNDEAVVWEMVQLWNSGKNIPPLGQDELRKTFESICDLNRKNGKKDKEKKDIDVAQFLDTEKKVTAEYGEQYVRIPFAGSLLSIMES